MRALAGSVATLLEPAYVGAGCFKTVALPDGAFEADGGTPGSGWKDAMETVWENGDLFRDWSFDEVRKRSEGG